MRSFPTWARLSVVATVVLLSPVLAFLMAIAVEIFIGILVEASLPALIVLVAAGAIGWSLLRRLRVRHRGNAPAET
jgi:hypothetical protein